jgi:hypothetical protein
MIAALAGSGACDLNTDPARHVTEKRRVGAQRFEGGGFVVGTVYELKGRVSGFIGAGDGTAVDLVAGEHSFHLKLAARPAGLQSGAIVRVLVRVNPDDGALTPISLVLDSAAEPLDPDPKPPAPGAETAAAQPTDKADAGEANLLVGLDPVWHDYFARVVRYFNPRLDQEKAGRIAYNILLQSTRWQVDPFLVVAVIAAESGFNPTAASPKGAMGLTQIMPETARSMGLTNPYNVEQNIYAGVRTIRGHLERNQTGNPWEQFALALASYNAGSGAVRRYGGVPPFKETRTYIQRVYSIYKALRESAEG